MSIKIQKVIKFIPIINFITVFLWLRSYAHNAFRIRDFMKKIFIIFALLIIISIPQILCSKFIHNAIVSGIFTFIGVYLYFLAIAWVAVSAQEEMLNK